ASCNCIQVKRHITNQQKIVENCKRKPTAPGFPVQPPNVIVSQINAYETIAPGTRLLLLRKSRLKMEHRLSMLGPGSLRGLPFESLAHRRLLEGGRFTIKCLGEKGTTSTTTIYIPADMFCGILPIASPLPDPSLPPSGIFTAIMVSLPTDITGYGEQLAEVKIRLGNHNRDDKTIRIVEAMLEFLPKDGVYNACMNIEAVN
ncbi:hypothetical protein DFH27DRAFT_625679, partial [Peziza echinospora]